MKFLLDQGLPRSAASILTDRGIDTVHVADVGLATAMDPAILDEASKQQRVIVTLDTDFHALLARSQAKQPSVIRIRIEGLKAAALSDVIVEVATRCKSELESGAVVSVTKGSIRVHLLPLV